MGLQSGQFRPFKVVQIGMVLLGSLLVMHPISADAGEKDRLPELQKAVGKDWMVTALPDGYLVTYVPLVSFYPAISESSKLDYHQRVARGRADHLRIRITYLYPPSIKKIDQYNAFWLGIQNGVSGYFECKDKDWRMWQDNLSKGQRVVCFSCNLAPDQLIPPGVQQDVYEHTLDLLAPYFHAARHEPWFID
jgi:hypothetical protein